MVKKIFVLNGYDPGSFPLIFRKVAAEAGMTSEVVDSKDCIIAVGYEGGPVALIVNNEQIPLEESTFYIKKSGQDTYRTHLIAKIIKDRAPIFSDEATYLSDKTADKITMMALLPLSGIKVPKSILTTADSYQINKNWILDKITFPCVLKKAGSRGRSVWKITNEEELEDKLAQDSELSLIQEYIPNEYDLRVFVFDNEVVVAIKRSSADGFYNNVSKGGKAEKAELTETEKEICLNATKIAKLRVAGVDIVRTENGPVIFEVNKSPQMDIFNHAAGFDLEKFYSERIVSELARASK